METTGAVKSETPTDTVRKGKGLLILGLMIAMLFAALDQTIVGTAMPRIVGDLGGLGLMAWLTTAYMLTSTVVVPIAGKLADLIGRRVVYVTGLVIFIGASALCGTAQDMTWLIIFRAMQGIGGGIIMPMAMIIIGDIFTGKERAKWMGAFGAVFGLSSVIGPQVGGWIVDSLNWRWVFYINLPVGLLAVVLIALALPKHKTEGKVVFDIPGMLTMIVGVVSLLLALTFGGVDYAWGSWQIIGLFALAAVAIAAFLMIEAKAQEPILPLKLFKNRVFSTINAIGFLMSVGMFGAIMFVPLFMQGIVGISASASGTVMTPLMITMIITSIIAGQIVYKIGIKVQMILGMIIMAVGFMLLTTMDIDTTKLSASGIMMVMGFGMGFVMPLLTLALQESFPKSELGVVTSSSQFFRSIGGTFGMTVLGAVMNSQSGKLLTKDLQPVLTGMDDQTGTAAKMIDGIHSDPQSVYSMLLSPDILKALPASFVEKVSPILKHTLISSLQHVFWVGLAFIVLGVVMSLMIGKIKLSQPDKKSRKERKEAAPMMH
ncbi:MDR family MFS transporter [Paenibacillus sepulcri]|uniref:MFS transporter n=1 Tax=Paenibacillus sepulcri TaxID=359917 RepID=A0ABS7C1E6_9BACL|nr:MFS transporter [Paenibacillus sepulcri]